MESNLYKIAVEIELEDDAGYHAVVIDAEDDEVIHVTNSFFRECAAEQAAEEWIARRRAERWPA